MPESNSRKNSQRQSYMKNLRISNSLVSSIAIFLAAIIIHGSMYFSPNIPEVGDYAANSILIQRAKLFQLFHGNYSRLEFFHPGPAFLQIQALGELILHDKTGLVPSQMGGQMIGALTLNCVLIWLLFSSVENWAGLAKGALFNVTFLICLMTSLPGVVTGFWLPYLYVLPCSCYVYSLALLHLGKLQDIQDKFIFFLSLGLVIHGHASFIGLSFIGFLVSICSTSFTRHRNLQDIASSVASLAKPRSILLIPIVFMLPILIDACVNFPGEFPKYILFTKKVAHNDLVESIRYALNFFPRGPRMVPLYFGVIGVQYFLSRKTTSNPPPRTLSLYLQAKSEVITGLFSSDFHHRTYLLIQGH